MLLDTCVAIDMLRGHAGALAFVNALVEAPSLSAITATELIAGTRNTQERVRIDRLLSIYAVHDIGLQIASLAGEYVRQYGPSHSVDPVDALIAATAKTHGLDLATLNLKHFPMFKGLKRPYAP
jgi:hypothetical protein